MLKPIDVQRAWGDAMFDIKRRKKMANMKYPLLEKKKYKLYFYFTDATGMDYDYAVGRVMRRKKNEVAKAPHLFCFEYDYKRDSYFIEDMLELTDHMKDLFDDYYEQYVEPNLITGYEKE